jgi:predicted component of viral defense system (DUF524 family)
LKNYDTLLFAIKYIQKYVNRRLVTELEYRNFVDISYVDNHILNDIISKPHYWFKGNWQTPKQLLQYENYEILDTPENRFVKYYINELIKIIDTHMSHVSYSEQSKIFHLKNSLTSLDVFLSSHNIGEMRYFPYNSQILTKRAGYRELFDIFNKTKPGNYKFSCHGNLRIKHISDIWEYVVFLELIELFGGIHKKSISDSQIYIQFKNNVELFFQKSFPTYSGIRFTPDFYMKIGNRTIIFDAKFRVFDKNKSDILRNMHYYKDGLSADLAIAISISDTDEGKIYLADFSQYEINMLQDILKFNDGVGYFAIDISKFLGDNYEENGNNPSCGGFSLC